MVSRVLTGKCHGTDLPQASRIQIRANGSGCLTRDTKGIANVDQQDFPCPLTRQHVIRSNYMGKSIEAKKKVCMRYGGEPDWSKSIASPKRSEQQFPHRKFNAGSRVRAPRMHMKRAFVSPPPVAFLRRFSFLGNRGIWSKRRKNARAACTPVARQPARCLSALRGCIKPFISHSERGLLPKPSRIPISQIRRRNTFFINARKTI